MTALVWDNIGERGYQSGVDRGVLYLPEGSGVCWNGLTSIVEKFDKEQSSVYYDGRKIHELVNPGDFSATIKAITYPQEFSDIDGTAAYVNGIFLSDQPPKSFGLCYRTLIGNDVEGLDLGYKIHILYNVVAVPKDRTFDTITDSPSLAEFEWDIWGVPEEISGFRPTCHMIVNSTTINPLLLASLEDLLYGSASSDPILPPMSELFDYIQTWVRIKFINNGDGTWTALISEEEDLVYDDEEQSFEILDVDATYPNADTWIASDTA